MAVDDKTDASVRPLPDVEASSSSTNSDAPVFTPADLKSAHRKTDIRLVLWYSFVYLLFQVHKGNISNTAIMNLEEGHGIRKQLGNLTSAQWAWCISIFYYPYLFFEPIATLALKRFTPRIWMARIMLTWGVISMCQGATKNYAGILACRFFLGLAEAGFYPGVLYHMSFWFPTHQLPFRIAFFYACGMFSGTWSGLLAYAISHMDQVGGLAGWRWMFILEGLPAIFCSVFTFFYLPNYPETATFLAKSEQQAIMSEIPAQAPTMKAKTIDWGQIKALFKDPTWVSFIVVWATHGIGGFGISYVLPTVIYELGLTGTAVTQLLTMPPSTLVLFVLLTTAYFTHTKRLSPWVAALGLESLQILMYILLITVSNAKAKYVFVMIASAGSQSFFPIIWPERIRAARGTTAAGLGIGITNAATQLSGIVGPQVYQPRFGPKYKVSFSTSIGLLCTTLISLSISWYLVRKGDQRRALEGEDKETVEQTPNIAFPPAVDKV